MYRRRVQTTHQQVVDVEKQWLAAEAKRKSGQGVPRFDNSGLHIEGRFQFRTTCMHRREGGPDCGCYLVDTSISDRMRSSCSKASSSAA